MLFELLQKDRLGVSRAIAEAELDREQLDECRAGQGRIRQVHTMRPVGLLLHRGANDGRLADARFADEERDAFPPRNRVVKVAQRLAVRLRHDQVSRVRREIEGRLAESEKIFVHQSSTSLRNAFVKTAGHGR